MGTDTLSLSFPKLIRSGQLKEKAFHRLVQSLRHYQAPDTSRKTIDKGFMAATDKQQHGPRFRIDPRRLEIVLGYEQGHAVEVGTFQKSSDRICCVGAEVFLQRYSTKPTCG